MSASKALVTSHGEAALQMQELLDSGKHFVLSSDMRRGGYNWWLVNTALSEDPEDWMFHAHHSGNANDFPQAVAALHRAACPDIAKAA